MAGAGYDDDWRRISLIHNNSLSFIDVNMK